MKTLSALSVALLFSFLCFNLANAANLRLEVSSGSNKNWIAVKVLDDAIASSFVEIKQNGATAWTKMTFEATGMNTGYWTFSDWTKANGFDLPLSFRLTGANGGVITLNSAVSSFPAVAQSIDSKKQYATATAASTKAPAAAPQKSTTTTTKAPVNAATNTKVTTTKAPVTTTKAPVTTTKAPVTTTKAPVTTTAAPKAAATTKPSSSDSACSVPTKLMVPLYVYPGAAWDAVANAGKQVKTVAIINPNSGPGGAPDSSYVTYMNKLNAAGVDMVGYVATTYGARAIADVKRDIDIYASQWPLLQGIFLDEAAAVNDAKTIAYYKELYNYIMAMPGWNYDIINPGVAPAAGYLDAATQIVSLEDYGTSVSAAAVPSFGSCASKEKFSAIVHTVSSGSMQSIVDAILNKKYFGYVYVTDGAGGCCTYNTLTSYYSNMASYVASKKI